VLVVVAWGEGEGWNKRRRRTVDQANNGGEQRVSWMLIEVGFLSEKEEKWKRESGVVEGGRV
jgi:hypothetical protein